MEKFLIILMLVLGIGFSLAGNPGARIRVPDNGLAYAAKIAKDILLEKLKTLHINDINARADTPIGHISYSLSSIKVNSFAIPTLTLKPKPGVGLELAVSGVSIDMSGHWHYRKDHWPHISDSGSFSLKADGISFTASIRIGADSQGHPTIAPAGCSSNIGGIHVHFSGGASWLYNLFAGKIEHSIKDSLQSQMCKAADSAITDQGAKSFARFPIKKKLDKYTFIDYSLVSSPKTTVSFIDLFLKGEFEPVAHPGEAPFSPEPLPTDSESSSMVYGWITDYMFNTAGFAYMKAGFLNHTFTPDDIKNSSYSLNTKTFQKIIPPLYDKYPNRPMKFKVYATKIPTVSSQTSGISLLFECNIEMFVDLANGSSVYALTLSLVVDAKVHVGIKDTNLTVHATFLSLKATLVRSAIGNITRYIRGLQFYLNFFVEGMIMKEINDRGEKGFPLPVNNGVKLVNPSIRSGKSFTLVSTDISYTPSKDEDDLLDLDDEELTYNGNRKIPIV